MNLYSSTIMVSCDWSTKQKLLPYLFFAEPDVRESAVAHDDLEPDLGVLAGLPLLAAAGVKVRVVSDLVQGDLFHRPDIKAYSEFYLTHSLRSKQSYYRIQKIGSRTIVQIHIEKVI